MAITANQALASLLAAATSRLNYCAILEAQLGAPRRAVAKRNGVTFRDVALTGPFVVSSEGAITSFGTASGTTVSTAATLSTGTSTLRIQSGSNWIEGTLGLAGSGCDFIMSANPTTTNGFAIGPVAITPPTGLPLEDPVEGIDILQIQFGQAGSMQTLTIAEQVYSGLAVGTSGATQSRWRCNPITVPAWKREGTTESLTGGTITIDVYPGVDSTGRTDVWFFASADYDAAGTASTGGPRTSSNRDFAQIEMTISIDGVPATLWDGAPLYSFQFQRATSMRWQSEGVAWQTSTDYISGLIDAGVIMPHGSQNVIQGFSPVASLPDQLTYKPFKQYGNIAQNANVGDMNRAAAAGGERMAVGFVHEGMARLIAEVGTHGNQAYATANRITTLKNLAETAAQVAIAGGIISASTKRLVDPGGDPDGPFAYRTTNSSTRYTKLLPQPGNIGTDALNMSFDGSHPPNVISYYAYQLSKDPFHLLMVQSLAATIVGYAPTNDNRRGTDGRTNSVVSDEERGYWWGLKCLINAWKITPAGDLPKPFLNKSFFETAITNTLNFMRINYIDNTSSYAKKVINLWGALQNVPTTYIPTSTAYTGMHPLSLDYGNIVLCHIRRMGYTAMDDVIVYHARNLKIRAQATGNYYIAPVTVTEVSNTVLIAAQVAGTDPEYTDGPSYAAWYPAGGKHTGNTPFTEWFGMRTGYDAGNYTFLFISGLAAYKHMVDQGWLTTAAIGFDPTVELALFRDRVGAPIGGETQFPKAFVKHYYDFES